MQDIKNNKYGMTLPELLIAAFILALVLVGILFSYTVCLELNEIAKNSSIAVYAAQAQLEDIKKTTSNLIKAAFDADQPKSTALDQIKSTYNGVAYALTGLTGWVKCYVGEPSPDILEVTVTVCWQQPNGRIIGEDADLDGQLDLGEDINGNGIIDSIVQLKTYIYF